MATNKDFQDGRQLSLVVSDPATPASNDPVRFGELVGVALTDERADGTTTVDFVGVFSLSAAAINGGGNSAIAVGDQLFYGDGDTPKISKRVAGRPAGFALEAVNAGATATIQVKLGR